MDQDTRDRTHLRAWQQRLLPLMTWMIAGLTIFFFAGSLIQLYVLDQRINEAPRLPPAEVVRGVTCPAQWSSSDCITLRRADTLALLESYTIQRRYHQANVIIMSGVWSRYLGFVTGMALAMVGAAFILGQISTSPNELGGSGGGWQLSLKSASPGLALAVLGVLLMIASIVTLHELHTRDAAVYTTNELPDVDWGIGSSKKADPDHAKQDGLVDP